MQGIVYRNARDLKVRTETVTLLEKNIGSTHSNIFCSKILFDPPSRAMEIKTKVNKWGLIKLKSLCTENEAINKLKRQPLEW